MYQIENTGVFLKRRAGTRSRFPTVARNVVLLGTVSLFTDISSEMVSTVLPLYLVLTLGASPLQFGIIDGIYQGASALVRLASGVIADRGQKHKQVAAVGYGVSAVCKLAFLAVGSAAAGIGAVILTDRTGKGIRTAPRDAMISLSSSPKTVGAAFGVHRAMDTMGAMIGPLVAMGLLALAPGSFNSIFVVSFVFGVIGFMVMVLFVNGRPERAEAAKPARQSPVTMGDAARLLRDVRFRRLVIVAGFLGLVTISDAFLYLGLQRRIEFNTALFPLLYVGTAVSFMILAIPIGKLADRYGRLRVFVVGYVLLLVSYFALLPQTVTPFVLLGCLAVFGAYYACTDGVLMAVSTSMLPEDLRASGMGILVTSTSIGRLGGSIMFGALWTVIGMRDTVIVFAVALAVMIVLATVVMRRPVSTAPVHV